jgi:hypothetical protein
MKPAFCGEVLRHAIKRHNETATHPFPYAFAFLVLPIVLHKKTRESIIPTKREQLHVWLQSHQDVRVGFPKRARQLVPITKESLAFLLQLKAITVDQNAAFSLHRVWRRRVDGQNAGEIADCYLKAEIVGRWFARAGSPANIYTMFGVCP